MRLFRKFLVVLFASILSTALLVPIAHSLVVTASGDTQGLCTQNVSDTTGVVVTKIGTECIVQFTSERTIMWTPSYSVSVRYLVVGGGGSGTRGYCSYYWGQGGGGGEVLTGNGLNMPANIAETITVASQTGRAGDCTQGKGIDGGASVLGTLTARGGKASLNSLTGNSGATGGVSGNGNAGGTGTANGGYGCATGGCQSGGGGGAGAAGIGKNAGAGINSDIITTGTFVMYGSGGAGWAGSGDVGAGQSGGAIPGASTCDAPVNRGGGGADCDGASGKGGTGGSGLVVIRYTFNNPPMIGAFSSAATATYTSPENSTALYSLNATDLDAGAVLTYTLTGTDAGDFAISSSGVLSFSPAPNFEAPSDSDTNNSYIVITWVSDGIYSDSQTVTVTVTDVSEPSSVSTPTVSGTAIKGVTVSVSVTANSPGKVRFLVKGKRIYNCLAVTAIGSGSNYTATCAWKPSVMGRQFISAEFTPTSGTFTASKSPTQEVWVYKRANTR